MRRPLPSIEHVARALLVQGARDAAIDLLEAAVTRGGEDRPRCDALLAAVRSRPHDRVSGPPIALDAALVETLAAHGRLVEAWAVARGASVGNTVAGVEITEALATVMEPLDIPEPWRGRWITVVATGNAGGIAAIERAVLAGEDVPSSLMERLRIALRLLRGYRSARADEDLAVPLPVEVRRAVRERLDAHDLMGALSAIRAAVEIAPHAAPVAMALARLIAATERLLSDDAPKVGTASSTQPLEGPGLALLQVRMGNFDDAERGFRRIVLERAADHVSRDRLADLLVVRRALEDPVGDDDGASGEALGTAKTPSPDWLNKRARKSSVEGWASAPRARAQPAPSWSDDDDSTSVIRPDEQAELHVKAGAPEKALPIYRRLVEKYPDRPRFRARLAEIEAMFDERVDLSETQPGGPTPQKAPARPAAPAGASPDATFVAKAPTRPAPQSDNEATTIRQRPIAAPSDSEPEDLFSERTSVDSWAAIAAARGTGTAAVTVRRIVRVGDEK
jgi:tetratricopeptide (TPR) repeat protein